jgi:hypothetical protein
MEDEFVIQSPFLSDQVRITPSSRPCLLSPGTGWRESSLGSPLRSLST